MAAGAPPVARKVKKACSRKEGERRSKTIVLEFCKGGKAKQKRLKVKKCQAPLGKRVVVWRLTLELLLRSSNHNSGCWQLT